MKTKEKKIIIIKALENRVKKKFSDTDQKSIVSLFSKDFLNEEATHESNKIVEMGSLKQ